MARGAKERTFPVRTYRQTTAEFGACLDKLLVRQCGAFVVLGSPMQRGVLSAVRWFLPELRDVNALDALESAIDRRVEAVPGPAAHHDRDLRRLVGLHGATVGFFIDERPSRDFPGSSENR
jgi:hypothetical protein